MMFDVEVTLEELLKVVYEKREIDCENIEFRLYHLLKD